MMLNIVALVLCLVLPSLSDPTKARDCLATTVDPYQLFGTKTSYQYLAVDDVSEVTLPGCTASQIWLFARHGTRWPRNDAPNELEMDNFYAILPGVQEAVLQNHLSGRGNLCQDDLTSLEAWELTMDPADEEKLSDEGRKEFDDLGERLTPRYPGLLDHNYNEDKYKFRFTTASRTEKSCRAFAGGVFGLTQEADIVYPEPIEGDRLIRFYQNCTKWVNEVDLNPATRIEKTLFEQGPEVANMVERVSNRLGFIYPLNYTEVKLVYDICRYDKALYYPALSPWCAAFVEEDVKVLEYVEDLDYYYKDGYGYSINYEQACPPLVDLLEKFKAVTSGQANQPYGYFYFSHSGAIAKFLARLGLFQDPSPPRADNYLEQLSRNWRTSRILPFASHVYFVLHKCDLDTWKVATYVNERLVLLPGCSSEFCSISNFMTVLGPIADSCDYETTCGL